MRRVLRSMCGGGGNSERTAGRGKWRGEGGGGGGEIELWEIKWRRDPLSSWNVLVGLSGGRLFVKGHLWVMKVCVCVCVCVCVSVCVCESCVSTSVYIWSERTV